MKNNTEHCREGKKTLNALTPEDGWGCDRASVHGANCHRLKKIGQNGFGRHCQGDSVKTLPKCPNHFSPNYSSNVVECALGYKLIDIWECSHPKK